MIERHHGRTTCLKRKNGIYKTFLNNGCSPCSNDKLQNSTKKVQKLSLREEMIALANSVANTCYLILKTF